MDITTLHSWTTSHEYCIYSFCFSVLLAGRFTVLLIILPLSYAMIFIFLCNFTSSFSFFLFSILSCIEKDKNQLYWFVITLYTISFLLIMNCTDAHLCMCELRGHTILPPGDLVTHPYLANTFWDPQFSLISYGDNDVSATSTNANFATNTDRGDDAEPLYKGITRDNLGGENNYDKYTNSIYIIRT